jgi:hypothetical protein
MAEVTACAELPAAVQCSTSDPGAPGRFLELLFGETASLSLQIGIFTLPDRGARHFACAAEAAAYALDRTAGSEVYFNVGLAKGAFGRRNCSADIGAIGGVWADIDMAAPWRAGKSLPVTIEEAKRILAGLPFAPTLLVHSGYGLHAYWLFKEPWVFESEEERNLAARTAKGWHGLVCSSAEALGWEMENLGDLARVLRLPGTFNHKGKPAVEVRVLEHHPERRYNPGDFEPYAEEKATEYKAAPDGGGPVEPVNEEVEKRAIAYLKEMAPAISGHGGHNATYAAATALVHGFCLPPERALALLLEHYNPRCQPPWTERELRHKAESAARNGHKHPYGWLRDLTVNSEVDLSRILANFGSQDSPSQAQSEKPSRRQEAYAPDAARAAEPAAVTAVAACDLPDPEYLGDLIDSCPSLRSPVIEGLLREGETMNLISAPKVGKSWLANDLGLAVATGRPWLGFSTVRGDVLIVDNELHRETLANRLPKVAAARGIPMEEVRRAVMVRSLRGMLRDLKQLEGYLLRFAPGRFKLIVLDAFYRFLPEGVDENDNGALALLYNIIDRLAERLGCAFVLIHHTSKGNQASKDVTDVGAGAGTQSRAVDAHVVLRHHEEVGSVVLEAKVRSWPPVEPRCLTWQHPVWMPAVHLDPTALYHSERKRRSSRESEPDVPDLTLPEMSLQEFVQKYAGETPRPKYAIIAAANSDGVSDHKAGRMLKKAESTDMLYRWVMDNGRVGYATVAQEALILGKDNGASTKRKEVEDALNRTPGLSNREIAKRCGVAYSYVRRIRKERES